MADEYNKFAPGFFGPGGIFETVKGGLDKAADAINPLPALYNVGKAYNDAMNYTFSPSEMADMMQGRIAASGANIERTPQPAMPASAGAPIVQPTFGTETGAGGGALPVVAKAAATAVPQASTATPYKFEDTTPTGTMMTGTGIPGIYQMPDGSYTNVSTRGEGGTAGLGPKESYDRAVASATRSLAGLPNTPAFAEMIKAAATELQGLGQLKDLFKPQVATTPVGGKTSTVGYDGTVTPITDNTGAYLQHQKMATDAVAGKLQETEKVRLQKQHADMLKAQHKNYLVDIDKINQANLEPAKDYDARRKAQIQYLQRIGMPEGLAEIPTTEQEYMYEQGLRTQAAGKQWNEAEKKKFQEYWKKIKPLYDKAYDSIMTKNFSTGK